ncbi:hypothetical protein EMCRGX_G030677 [Ephydatia muelleri]
MEGRAKRKEGGKEWTKWKEGGVGGIEAEAIMLGQTISMVLPEVVGYKLIGAVGPLVTSTDVVLTITKLSIADRASIANMCPEYGATVGFFPVDDMSLKYLHQTGRDAQKVKAIELYLKAAGLYRHFSDADEDPTFSQVVELDLSKVVPSISGPKRPQDRVNVSDMKEDFRMCLENKVGFKGFAIEPSKQKDSVPFEYEGKKYTLRHGSVVISAITSCTNTSNPSVMMGAGLLAKNTVEKGLTVAPYIKTSLSPGSRRVGVKAVIAESFERIQRSNLVGMGIVPLQYLKGQTAATLGLDGTESYSFELPEQLTPGQNLTVKVAGKPSFEVKARFDTEVELVYFKHGGILNYMVRKML